MYVNCYTQEQFVLEYLWRNGKTLHLNWKKRKCVCMYSRPLELMAAKHNWIDLCRKDWSIDWLIFLTFGKNQHSYAFRQVVSFSHFLEICETTSCSIFKFVQFNGFFFFAPYLIQCAGPSGSLIVTRYRESNHLSHSCDKAALERFKCQVVFITSIARLGLNLSLVYAATLPLLQNVELPCIC